MTSSSSRALGSIALSTVALALAGCAGESAPSQAAPPLAMRPAGTPRAVIGSYVAHLRPKARTLTFERLDTAPVLPAGAPGPAPQNETSLQIVQDGVAGSGPADSVELVTNSVGTDAQCPSGYQSNSFCGNVTLRHFYPIGLSAVYVQVTAIKDDSGNALSGHSGMNSDAAAFGLDNSLGLWEHGAAGMPMSGMLGLSPDNAGTRDWVFANPDDADINVVLNVVASYYPTLWFSSSGTITQTAPLNAGQPATIHYEYARNTKCRGFAWVMNGFFNGPNTYNHTVTFTGNATDTYFDVDIATPFGTPSFWFNNTDDGGCQNWDSNGGANFGFGAAQNPTADAILHFQPPSNWTPWVEGTVRAGGTFAVDYALKRLQCWNPDSYDRVPSVETMQMGYMFNNNGATATYVPLTGNGYGVPSSVNGSAGSLQVSPTISIPAGTTDLAVWFHSTDTSPTCDNYDSNSSANYHFSVQ
jgi:hypothetical protein